MYTHFSRKNPLIIYLYTVLYKLVNVNIVCSGGSAFDADWHNWASCGQRPDLWTVSLVVLIIYPTVLSNILNVSWCFKMWNRAFVFLVLSFFFFFYYLSLQNVILSIFRMFIFVSMINQSHEPWEITGQFIIRLDLFLNTDDLYGWFLTFIFILVQPLSPPNSIR